MEVDLDLEYIDEVDAELAHQFPIKDENIASTSTEEDSSQGESLRNQIAMQIWNGYVV